MVKDLLTEGLTLCVRSQVGLESDRVNDGNQSFDGVQWRPRLWNILSDMSSVVDRILNIMQTRLQCVALPSPSKDRVDDCETVSRGLDFYIVHGLHESWAGSEEG